MERLHFGVRQMFNVVIWGKVEDVILVKQWLDLNRGLCSEMGYVCVKEARSSGTGELQSWPNVVERKVKFHVFTFNLNNNPPPSPPPIQCCLGLFSARNKHHTISFISARNNIGKGVRGSSFFSKSVKILQLARLYTY